jgi:hypothetical protein
VDGWLPSRFRHLSTRLVVQNGVILFGIFALGILYLSRGKVSWLVILYSINVFITFSLSLLGLCVYWAKRRSKASPYWVYRLLFSMLAFIVASSILCVTLFSKFRSGGWVTVIITCMVIFLCILIKRHYKRLTKKINQIDKELKQPITEHNTLPSHMDPLQPTAVILVGKSPGVGMHTLLCVIRMFPRYFKNFIFLSAGIVDVGSFIGQKELENMRQCVSENLQYFVDYCHQYDLRAQGLAAYGTDTVEELGKMAEEIGVKFPNSIFFASKLIFENDNWLLRFLHNENAIALQRVLHLQGKELVILPMKI